MWAVSDPRDIVGTALAAELHPLPVQTLTPGQAKAAVMERPRTETLGVESRNAAAEMQDIIMQRTGRPMPFLTSSPALTVRRPLLLHRPRGSGRAGSPIGSSISSDAALR